MTNKKKLEVLKAFLTENGIEFVENRWSRSAKMTIDLYVWKYRIYVHISDENDDEFFNRTKGHTHPFFIRDNETVEFVIEKMQNCILDIMKREQRRINGLRQNEENQKRHDEKVMEKAKTKRKRVRIPVAERVVPRKKG